jgi:hypothetical protein
MQDTAHFCPMQTKARRNSLTFAAPESRHGMKLVIPARTLHTFSLPGALYIGLRNFIPLRNFI